MESFLLQYCRPLVVVLFNIRLLIEHISDHIFEKADIPVVARFASDKGLLRQSPRTVNSIPLADSKG